MSIETNTPSSVHAVAINPNYRVEVVAYLKTETNTPFWGPEDIAEELFEPLREKCFVSPEGYEGRIENPCDPFDYSGSLNEPTICFVKVSVWIAVSAKDEAQAIDCGAMLVKDMTGAEISPATGVSGKVIAGCQSIHVTNYDAEQ